MTVSAGPRARAQLDLAGLIRPGDVVSWPHGTGEPRTLTEQLVSQRRELGGVRAFFGPSYTTTLRPESIDGIECTSYCGIGANAALAESGSLEIVPLHLAEIPRLLANGELRVDVVLLQLSPADASGRHSLGTVADYVHSLIEHARTVVAEVNDQAPFTFGDTLVDGAAIGAAIETSRPLIEIPVRAPGEAELAIAARAAELIPDRATLQIGVGGTPDAIAGLLRGRRDLGLHSGTIGDSAVELIECGAVSNEAKPIDRGLSVAGSLTGSRRLYEYADRNEAIALRPVSHTHALEVLARLPGLVAVNGALEVDLSGQVNSETAAGRYVGATGGQVDFVRGAAHAPSGRSIFALPSTARRGSVSRIVRRLSGPTTTARTDVDTVITEHGVAELRGVSLTERARRLAAIADPAFRGWLRQGRE